MPIQSITSSNQNPQNVLRAPQASVVYVSSDQPNQVATFQQVQRDEPSKEDDNSILNYIIAGGLLVGTFLLCKKFKPLWLEDFFESIADTFSEHFFHS